MRRSRILGPVVLITIGVLFALDNIWGIWSFRQTWPIILVVIGIVKLLERVGWDDRGEHYGQPQPWGPPTPPAPPPAPPQETTKYPGDSQNVS